MTTLEEQNEILAEARNPDGSPRFYPFGRHPASAQWRKALATLEEFADRYPRTPTNLQQQIDYATQQIAAVEEGEARAKQAYLAAHSPTEGTQK